MQKSIPQKEQFIIKEFLMLTINAGLATRNQYYPIYKKEKDNESAMHFKTDVNNYLIEYLYQFNNCNENEHYDKIENMSKILSEKHKNILHNERFRIGVSQKLINLFLKYYWTIDKIKTPFHCPFDNGIKLELNNNGLQDWTKLDSLDEYKKYVYLAKTHADKKNISIAEWELSLWNNIAQKRLGLEL